MHARILANLEAKVYQMYPETEPGVPVKDQLGAIPAGIREAIDEAARKMAENPKKKHRTVAADKNATPGLHILPMQGGRREGGEVGKE